MNPGANIVVHPLPPREWADMWKPAKGLAPPLSRSWCALPSSGWTSQVFFLASLSSSNIDNLDRQPLLGSPHLLVRKLLLPDRCWCWHWKSRRVMLLLSFSPPGSQLQSINHHHANVATGGPAAVLLCISFLFVDP